MSTRILISLESLFGSEAAKRYQCYICPECDEILNNAVQTNCGHILCEDHVEYAIFKYKEQARCPQIDCNKFLRGDDGIDLCIGILQYFPDRWLRREIDEINKLKVECPLVGCVWTGFYKDFIEHCQSQHPSAVWQLTPKRRAPRAVVTIQHEQSLDQASQPGKKSEQSPDFSKYTERLKADSLKTSQKKAGSEASSNQSLKRASEPEVFQGQSNTLDASTACADQVRFETTPEIEVMCTEELMKKGNQQLVHGSSREFSHQRNPSDVSSKLPLLTPSATDAVSQEPPDTGNASASSPRRHFQENRRRKLPPTFSIAPRSPTALIVPTHQPSASNVLSPTSQFQLPTISQASNMEQDSIPIQPPTSHVPPPSILSTSKTPVPRRLGKSTKSNSMPQDSNNCCQCKRKGKQLVVLQKAFKELLKENASPTCTCSQKNSFRRNRLMSL